MARPPTHISELLDEVTKVITLLVDEEKQFTILDISEEVKKELAVSHQDVRIIAKPILDNIILRNGFYETAQIQVDTPNGKATAILYLPDWTDPDDYTDRSKVATKPVVTQPAAPAPTPTPVQPVAKNCCSQTAPACVKNADWWKIVNPRSDGKVAVPAAAFRIAGLSNRVGVKVHPNSISLEDGNDLSIRELRIGTADLSSANLINKPVYICVFKGKIVLCS